MTTITQTISTLPDAPDPFTMSPTEFSEAAAESVLAQKDMVPELNTWAGQVNTVAGEVNAAAAAAIAALADAADEAAAAAASADVAEAAVVAAGVVAGVALWVSGTPYAIDVPVISPSNRHTYRKKTALSSSATDPANDAANWVQLTGIDRGGDGASAVATVVLTPLSPGAQSMTPTGYGSSFKLPDATGCSKGTTLFSLGNPSTYAIKILNNAGVLIGFVPPFSSVDASLAANATAAGVWNLPGSIPIAVTAEFSSYALTLGSSTTDIQMCSVDATRTLLTTGQSSGGDIYGVVYDSSTGLFGAITLIRAAAYIHRLVKCADGKILFVSVDTATGVLARVMTITGTSIAFGTNAGATLSGTISQQAMELVSVSAGAAFAWSYGAGSQREVRAVSVSGTTPSVGAAVILNGSVNSCQIHAVSSTAILAITFVTSTTFNFRGVGISGNVATLGTEVTTATDVAVGFRSFVWGARWACLYCNAGAIRCALVTMTGTTPAITSAAGTGGVTSNFTTFLGVQVSGLKAVVIHNDNSAGHFINLFTDNGSGTVSAGTALSPTLATSSSVAPLGVVSNVAYFLLGQTNQKVVVGYTISGASPVLAYAKATKTQTGGSPSPTTYKDADIRNANTLISSQGLFVIPQTDGPASLSNKDGVQILPNAIAGLCSNAGQPGPSANESWVYAHPYTAATSILFQRVECVA